MIEPKPVERPLSPHLMIYRPMLSMSMSIFHRITGVILSGGVVLLVIWLLAAAMSDEWFNLVQSAFGFWAGRIVLFGVSWAIIHHALGGIRYLIWDTGRGFALDHVEWLVRANFYGAAVLTIILWIGAFQVWP